MKRLMCVFVLVLTCSSFGRAIVERGTTQYQIVCPSTPPLVTFAGKELQIHIKRMTGATLPIVQTKTGPAIVLTHDTTMQNSSYKIEWEEDSLVIRGNNASWLNSPAVGEGLYYHWGTLNGTYALLETLGCRWYFPGPLGEIIPKKDTLEVPDDFSLFRTPAFTYRQPNRGMSTYYLWSQVTEAWVYGSQNGDTFRGLWAGRNGCGNDTGAAHNHSWAGMMQMAGSTTKPSPWSEPCPASAPEGLACGHPEYMAMPGARQHPTHYDYQRMQDRINEALTLSGPTLDQLASDLLGYPVTGLNARLSIPFVYLPEEGTRSLLMGGTGYHQGQICTSNPGVINLAADWANNLFKDPNRGSCSLSQNDGGGFCNCVHCRALDGSRNPFDLYGDLDGDRDVDQVDFAAWQRLDSGEKSKVELSKFTTTGPRANDSVWLPSDTYAGEEEGYTGQSYISDRMIEFYNRVAILTSIKYPDRFVEGYLYGQGSGTPRRPFIQHPNVRYCLVFNNAWRASNNVELGNIGKLKALKPNIRQGSLDIYDMMGWKSFGCPQPMSRKLADRVRYMYENGVSGHYPYMGVSPEHFGFEMYLWSKLMWDPYLDVELLKQTYFTDLYGPAGDVVKSYYEAIEEARNAALETFVGKCAPASVRGIDSTYQLLALTFADLTGLELRIKEAETLTATASSPIKERVKNLRSNFELTKSTAGAIQTILKIYRSPEPNADDLATYVKHVINYTNQLAMLGFTYHRNSQVDAEYDATVNPTYRPFSRTFGLFQLATWWSMIKTTGETIVVLNSPGISGFVQRKTQPNYYDVPSVPGMILWTSTAKNKVVTQGDDSWLEVSPATTCLVSMSKKLPRTNPGAAILRFSCKVKRTNAKHDPSTYGSFRGYFRTAPPGATSSDYISEYVRACKVEDVEEWENYDNYVFLKSTDYTWTHTFSDPLGGELAVKDIRITYYCLTK